MIATSHSKIGIVELLTYFCYWGAREKLRALQGMAVQREAPMVVGPNLELKGRKAGLGKSLVSEVSAEVSTDSCSVSFRLLDLVPPVSNPRA